MTQVSHGIDRIDATFDDPSLVANAGLILPATLMVHLGVEALVNSTVHLVGRVGGALPGRKICTLVATILAGGSHIDHANVLRAGATQRVLPFRVMAPSTLGTFLRSFDMDSTICEVHGKAKHGAAYGYTRQLGYHPLLATRADTGEVLHGRLRKGSSQRGHKRFVEELIARVRRCGATGPLTLRADSGFWSWELIDSLTRLGVNWSVTVSINQGIRAAIDGIDNDAWTDIVYPDGGQAQVADTVYVTGRGKKQRRVRLVVRRTRLTETAQRQLWPDWRHHAFVTDLDTPVVEVDQFHRDHARVELAIRDLKEGAGLEHCPSGRFFANAAWLACAVLAHNITRWTARLGHIHPDEQLTVTRTIRTRLFALPGRLVNRSGRPTLRLPDAWPWERTFTEGLGRLRGLPQLA